MKNINNINLSKFSKEKQDFLNEIFNTEQPKEKNQITATLFALQTKAKEHKITFSKEEILEIYNMLNPNISDSQKAKVEKMISILK